MRDSLSSPERNSQSGRPAGTVYDSRRTTTERLVAGTLPARPPASLPACLSACLAAASANNRETTPRRRNRSTMRRKKASRRAETKIRERGKTLKREPRMTTTKRDERSGTLTSSVSHFRLNSFGSSSSSPARRLAGWLVGSFVPRSFVASLIFMLRSTRGGSAAAGRSLALSSLPSLVSRLLTFSLEIPHSSAAVQADKQSAKYIYICTSVRSFVHTLFHSVVSTVFAERSC